MASQWFTAGVSTSHVWREPLEHGLLSPSGSSASPRRLNAVAGAADAAAAAGQSDVAADYYRQLLDLTVNADTELPAMARAREYLGSQ